MNNEVRMSTRREWKQKARKVVKTHYMILIILALLAVFLGTEFTFVSTQARNMYSFVTDQELLSGG
ncbi:MAG: hypothetical protein IJL71_00970, partial [Oscillospiraceae bacterium]|nr:hypothetical protein [Oscillospiraceae bacterium]